MANQEQAEAARKAAEAAAAAAQKPPTTIELLTRLTETPQTIQGTTSAPNQQ